MNCNSPPPQKKKPKQKHLVLLSEQQLKTTHVLAGAIRLTCFCSNLRSDASLA